ncbi:hypothetical protein ACFZB5_22170 [Streptomyces nodosus]|uniref:hypothetical protein n=1 Tax=Streptomyces nodosus TaxID=40318 RepID=UPI0036E32874
MPRGRHRHSPPLHRLLPPSVIAGFSVVCAVGPWLFTEPSLLRGLAAGAAVTTILGTFVMRRWDLAAGKIVADLERARAGDEWRHEERVAELETELEESRELRGKLEQKLRAKRAEVTNLRNEHASLLRRYATAETERASALEGRRLLAIDSPAPAPALPAGDTGASDEQQTPDPVEDASAATEVKDAGDAPAAAEPERDAERAPSAPRAFSPEGSVLFERAGSALARLAPADGAAREAVDAQEDAGAENDPAEGTAAPEPSGTAGTDTAAESTDEQEPDSVTEEDRTAPAADATSLDTVPQDAGRAAPATAAMTSFPENDGPADEAGNPAPAEAGGPGADAGDPSEAEAEALSTVVAVPEHEAVPAAQEHQAVPEPRQHAGRPAHATGHFTVPTAVAVVPPTPRRRPTVQGGFDFFGTRKPEEDMAFAQNETLADASGRESLAMHKAESESGFKPMDPQALAVGQVIDLTAHDETEQIDIQGLRTSAS